MMNPDRHRIALLVLGICLCTTGATWTWRNPYPQGEPLSRVFRTGDVFVGLTRYGDAVVSPDGLTWDVHATGIEGHVTEAVRTGTRLVVFGPDGNVATSENGVDWNVQHIGGDPWTVRAVVTTDSLVAAAVERGYILVSADGLSWKRFPSRPAVDLVFDPRDAHGSTHASM